MWNFIQDVRYALRQLRRSPGFAAAAILSLAMGIGANTAIFGWMRSLLLNPFPGATQPSRIVAVENTAPDGRPISTSYLDFRDYLRAHPDAVRAFSRFKRELAQRFPRDRESYIEGKTDRVREILTLARAK